MRSVAQGVDASTSGRLALRVCIVLTLFTTTVFARFGLSFGDTAITFSTIALYCTVIALLLSRHARLDASALCLYGAVLLIAYVSWFINSNFVGAQRTSPASLMLLAALYLPFVMTAPRGISGSTDWQWALRAFSNIALLCAFAGIAQFFTQFVYNPFWLFDFTPLIPESLRFDGVVNTVIRVGDLYKSNGFFLREPSAFSFLVALGAIVELATTRRWWHVAVFGFALLLTYSGTGLLALGLGLLFPLGWRSLGRLLGFVLVGSLLIAVLGDALNLSFTLQRIQEFDSQHSSAYYRYIAPFRMLAASLDTDSWSAWLGHGAGSIQRVSQSVEAFDPTWAKLLFEYGVCGFLAQLALILYALQRSAAPSGVRAVLFFSWLMMGGHLLSPDNVSTLYVLACLWQRETQPATTNALHRTAPRGLYATGAAA